MTPYEERIILLPNNDNLSQYCRSLQGYFNEDFIKQREREINDCNHLFLKIRKKEYCGSYHSSDCMSIPPLLECVHCGLTNKFEDHERVDIEIKMERGIYGYREHQHTIETIMFHKIYKDAFIRCGKDFDESKLNIISDEVIRTDQARLLYELAKDINPKGKNEELFTIMKEINEIETDLEKFKLSKVSDCKELLIRYKESKSLNYKKKLVMKDNNVLK